MQGFSVIFFYNIKQKNNFVILQYRNSYAYTNIQNLYDEMNTHDRELSYAVWQTWG